MELAKTRLPFREIKGAASRAVEQIQSRLGDVEAGSLSIASGDEADGALSPASQPVERGRPALPEEPEDEGDEKRP